MSPEQTGRILTVLTQIKTDIDADVAKHDGQLIDGKRVAQMHGELSAVVYTLAAIIEKIVKDDE